LREVPLVPLRVCASVPAMAEREIGELLDDLRAGRLRALVMLIDAVDEHVHVRCSPDPRRIPEVPRRLPEVDATVLRCLQLRVKTARAADAAIDLVEAERMDQELDRGFPVFVEQVRSDCLCHSAEAKPPAPPRLGKKLRVSDP
jgi:hypothetical protein